MKLHHLATYLLLGLLLAACNQNKVTITEFSPVGEVKDLQSFTIRFSEALAPEDQQDQWLTDEFITFKPAIDGRFKWTSANTLLFSPDRPLEPSTAYTAKVTKKVTFDTKFSLKAANYKFNTAFFDIENAEIFWDPVPRTDHEVKVVANLYFNYEVDPENLANYLVVSGEGSSNPSLTINTQEPSKVVALDLGTVKQTYKTQKFTIKVKSGVQPISGTGKLEEVRDFSLTLPPITRLAISSASTRFEGDKPMIEIRTTQPIDPKRISSYVTVSPKPARLSFKADGNSIRVYGQMKAGDKYNLRIKKGMPGHVANRLQAAVWR
ncbi:MAG: Ig-like domain-containing protein, partial [Bacteroidota bacterium]